jgi:cytochrome c biogenesis protein CcmG, thiol:disulfide interchange protein DsbE
VPDLVAFAEKAGDRVGLVGVLTQDTEENGLEFSRQFGIGYPSLVDPDGEVFRAFRPGPPVTLFLDAQGTVRHKVSGKVDSLEQLEALVAEHLGVSV